MRLFQATGRTTSMTSITCCLVARSSLANLSAVSEFDDKAATWDEDPRRVARTAAVAAAIAEVVPLAADWSVLEYGPGTGALGRTLASSVGSVVLMDASPGMIAVAKQRVAAQCLTNVDAVVGDLTCGEAPAGQFDLVTASLVLHHVADVSGLLARFAQLLRPGGWLAVADLDQDVSREYHAEGFGGHHGFERAALASDLEAAGYDCLAWRTVFQMPKTTASGHERLFPVFLVTGARGR